jgi:hypothetical protein
MKNRFYKTNFVFVANRYEEWQAGRCISQGTIQTEIIAEVSGNTIHFELDDIGKIRMLKSFDFDIYGEDYCILPDRIQYSYGTSDFNPIVPMVCNIFYSGNTMQYVRFAMTNPDRLVEFYGSLVKLGQPSNGRRKVNEGNIDTSAETILKELRSYGMVKADAIMERAVKLYNDNANVTSIDQAKKIIESLKLFVKAYQLDEEEHEEPGSPLKCKILMFIALCNYTIDNINRAYCIAKQGLDAINEAIENSHFTGIPRSMYGEDTIKELMDAIETNRYDEVTDEDDYYEIDPEEIDTTRFEEIAGQSEEDSDKPSKQQIKLMIETISHVQEQFVKTAERLGDSMRGFQIKQSLEAFKLPLFFAWRGYKYGWHTDWCEEGDSLFPFMMFEADLKKNTQDLIDLLRTQSPFAQIERNSMITNTLISIYSTFISDIDNGTIKL